MSATRPVKIAILGNSGSGKSTLAHQFGLAHLDLDTVAWEPNAIAVARPRAAAIADVRAFCAAHDDWVVEGCYAGLVEVALDAGALLVFLDPGVEACLDNCRARPFEPHKFASPKEQDGHLAFLLEWVRGYESREDELSRREHEALFERHTGPKRRLTDRSSFAEFIREAREPGSVW